MTAQLDIVTWLASAEPPSPVLLHRIDPTRNMRRFYALSIEPTPFGEFAIVTRWGHVSSPRGQMRSQCFITAEEAGRAMQRQMQMKLRRGYDVARVEGRISGDQGSGGQGRVQQGRGCGVAIRPTRHRF